MIRLKNLALLQAKLISIKGIGEAKSDLLINYMKNDNNRKELDKLLKEVTLISSFGIAKSKGRIIFTGCRPTDDDVSNIQQLGYEATDKWSNDAHALIIPFDSYTSSKVEKAVAKEIPIITLEQFRNGGIL